MEGQFDRNRSMAKTASVQAESLRKNEEKWTKTLMEAGWNAIPSVIIERQQALGLDAIDMNILLHLTNYWWKADNLPRPAVGTIAATIGIKPRTVQKRIAKLEADGFLTRTERRKTRYGSDTNLYSFEGLIEKCLPFAKEKLEARKARDKEEKDRAVRKRPKLALVSDTTKK